jgi:ATP-dependent DNA ligase
MPGSLFQSMLCASVERPPEGSEWRYELKLDGFRAIGRRSGRSMQLWSRNQKDFTRRFPGVATGIAELPSDTVIDGEIVALDEGGKPSFNLLQGFGNASAIVLYAFDLLMLRGKYVRHWRLDDRREELRSIIQRLSVPASHQIFIPHFEELRMSRCPFANLPDRGEGRWGEGLTTTKMAQCGSLHPFVVARIEFSFGPRLSPM